MGKAEASVEGYLLTVAKAKGAEVRKAMWVARRGCPDRRVMTAGIAAPNFWVEAKSRDGRLDDHQIREHERMRARGELVFTVSTREQVDALPWGC